MIQQAARKRSRLRYLPEIPAHWSEHRAKFSFREVNERSTTGTEELLSVSHLTGVTPRSEKNVTMMMAESTEGHKLCRPGDLAINTLWAWMGALGVSQQVGIVSPAYGVYRLRGPNVFRSRFIDLLLRTPMLIAEYYARSRGVQDSRLRLYPESFLDIPIPCPPLSEQDAIVACLDQKEREIAEYIATKQRMIEVLEERRDATISAAIRPSIGRGNSAAPLVALRRMTEVIDCKHITADFADAGYPLASVREVQRLTVDLSSANKTSPKYFELLSDGGRKPKRGDLIFCRNTSINASLVDTDEEFAMGQDVCLIKGDGLCGRYLVYALRSTVVREQLDRLLVGATIKRINVADVRNLAVPLLSLGEQVRLARRLDADVAPIDSARLVFEREIAVMQEYRTALIADVVTGRKTLRAADRSAP